MRFDTDVLFKGIKGLVATALFFGIAHVLSPLVPQDFVLGSYGALAVILIALQDEPVASFGTVLSAHLLAATTGSPVETLGVSFIALCGLAGPLAFIAICHTCEQTSHQLRNYYFRKTTINCISFNKIFKVFFRI
ncbi:hypothetical protein HPQ64_01995 [Rhizobiales bacterium]|uniref:hypothetical protein n=1 Tax=Hongsoonwoonella zoysiae TaxID=2821844 RepID=UPI0015618273|nr:hypothetical protein [Hongsoonwoonella zoysiae]NRG16455.1 hypothetical protein [Hongsoonwoonella zoysiae]